MIVAKRTIPLIKTPEAPSPVTALPAIKAAEEGANAQTRLPTSKVKRYMRKVIFFENNV